MKKLMNSVLLTSALIIFASCGMEEATEEKDITPPTTSSGTNLNGEALYASNCQMCHGELSNSAVSGSSARDINNAISNVSSMSNFSFNSAEINAISSALN